MPLIFRPSWSPKIPSLFQQQLPSTPHTHAYTLGLSISHKCDSNSNFNYPTFKLLPIFPAHFLWCPYFTNLSFLLIGTYNTLIFTCLPSLHVFIPLFPASIAWSVVITPLHRCLTSLTFSHSLRLSFLHTHLNSG